MNSISFPNMFASGTTKVCSELDATTQNVYLLLKSEKGGLSIDPYFGIRLRRYTFEQNSYVLKDILIDEIYTQLAQFMPQIRVKRKDIELIQKGEKVYVKFKAQNKIDFVTNMYELVLFNVEER